MMIINLIKAKYLLGKKHHDINLIDGKRKFIEMRNQINCLDRKLSLIISLRTIKTIFTLMVNIYQLSHYDLMRGSDIIIKLSLFTSVEAIAELVISCLISASIDDKCRQISDTLDEIDSNYLSESEFNELILFIAVCRNSRFGFTIGGFASLGKSTLIAVSNLFK